MSHPDFRVNGKVFATLKHDELTGMVALTPEQQQEFVAEDPRTFSPESGAWGQKGYTKVLLATASEDMLGRALTLARQNLFNRQPAKKSTRKK